MALQVTNSTNDATVAGAAEAVERARHSRVSYQPALDGLRAVAVLLVLLLHNGLLPPNRFGLRGGGLGVDIFFVLSGYLITSLLLAEHTASGHIDVRAFWSRRARRLLPALFVTLCFVAISARSIVPAQQLQSLRADGIATLLYVQNWHEIVASSPWHSPLEHAWSLSVEEQWYLLWPLAFGGLLLWNRRAGTRRKLFWAVTALAAAFVVWSRILYATGPAPSRLFYATDVRGQQLLIGAALAAFLVAYGRVFEARAGAVEAAGIGGCLLAAVVIAHPEGSFLYQGGFAIFGLAVAAVITAAVQPTSAVIGPLLSLKPLRAIGLISYGIYLYHWPLFFWLTPDRVPFTDFSLFLVRTAATIAVATASFFLIERPIRRGAVSGVRLASLGTACAAVVVITTLAGTVEPSPKPLLPRRMLAAYHQAALTPGRRVMVVGDDRALQLQLAGQNVQPGFNGVSVGFAACPLLPGDVEVGDTATPAALECKQLPQVLQSMSRAFAPDVVVVFPGEQELYDRRYRSRDLKVGTAAWRSYVVGELDRMLASLAPHAPVIFVEQQCATSTGEGAVVKAITHNQRRIEALNDVLRTYAATRSNSVAATLDVVQCVNGTPVRFDGREKLLFPNGQLAPSGTARTWKWIEQQAEAAASRS